MENKEYCEWESKGTLICTYYETSCKESYNCDDIGCTLPHNFTYCPYCGKKIQVKDVEE